MEQLAPVQSEELEAALPCVLAEAPPDAEAPGDLPLCAHEVANMAATIATPIALKTIETSLGW
ncbi:MAG: hypothetical protein ACJ8G5_12030 [Burkholderiales bacterium]